MITFIAWTSKFLRLLELSELEPLLVELFYLNYFIDITKNLVRSS
jgi:hypothetical protein